MKQYNEYDFYEIEEDLPLQYRLKSMFLRTGIVAAFVFVAFIIAYALVG